MGPEVAIGRIWSDRSDFAWHGAYILKSMW